MMTMRKIDIATIKAAAAAEMPRSDNRLQRTALSAVRR